MRKLLNLAIAMACWPVMAWGQDHARKAVEFVQRGELKSAADELRKALAESPNDAALLTSLGGVLGMEGDLQHASPYLAKAVELDPQNPALRRNLAANQWQLGKLTEARTNLERLLHSDPNDQAATFLLGMVYADQKDYNRSASLLESAPEVFESQPQGWIALAGSYYHTGRPEQGRTALRKLLRSAANPDLIVAAGQTALDGDDPVTAESLFGSIRPALLESVRTGQARPDVYLRLCRILAFEGSLVRALEVASQAAAKFPNDYEVLSMKASLEMKLQYYVKAVDSSERAFALRSSPETMRNLAAAEWKAGLRKQAASRFERMLVQDSRDAATREQYGTLLLDEGSPRALELLRQAVALDGSSEDALYQLANAELAGGKTERALQYLQRALKLRGQDSRVHYALSRVYRRLGRPADAENELQSYLALKGQTR